MADSNRRKSMFFLVLFAVCLSFFNAGCGLDVLAEILDDPFSVENQPNSESSFDTCYFKFSTRRLSNANDMGRAYIYYKIYNDDQKVSSEESSLISKADDSVGKLSSATYMRETYGYKQLHYITSAGASSSAFDLSNARHEIRIRLTNYSDEIDDYSAAIFIDEQKVGIPVRMNGKTFDFGRDGSDDENPANTHNEENAASSDTKGFLQKQDDGEENIFYVAMFGVFEQPNDTWDPVFSPIHFLGRVKINANERNN